MAKYILDSAGNFNWMAIFALLTFISIFVVGVIQVFRKDKKFIDKMSRLPLDDEE